MTETLRTWRLDKLGYDRPPLSLNYRLNRYEAARVRAEVMDRVHGHAVAARLPRGLERVGIVLWWRVNTRHRRDEDNLAPTLKACCDALCSGTKKRPGYGLTVDDDWTHVTSGTAIEYVPREPMTLWLEITDLSGTS